MNTHDRNARIGEIRFLRIKLALGLPLCLLVCGCQVLTYRGPNGEQFTRAAMGVNLSVSSLIVETSTNGLRRVELRGYINDSTQALGIVTEAAVRAAIQGVK